MRWRALQEFAGRSHPMESDATRPDMDTESFFSVSPILTSSGESAASAVPECSRAALTRLCETGVLSAAAWDEALRFCGLTPDSRQWREYWRHIFLLGGALFSVAGIIFFIAWNWADMHRFLRMALAGCLVAGTGLASVRRGPDTPLGRVLLLSCGICVGPMLAVFGQAYQTGADLWELFRVWTVVLLALAVAGRQSALWFVTWFSGNVFVMLWLGRSMDSPLAALGMFSLMPECVLALACAVVLWEWFAHRARLRDGKGRSWLLSRWFPRLLFFDLTIRLTVYLLMKIFGGSPNWYEMEFLLPREPALPLLAAAVACGSWYWHCHRAPDLFMPACIVAASAVLLVGELFKMDFLFYSATSSAFLWGVLLVGITAGVAKILLVLQRKMEAGRGGAEKPRHGLPGMEFFAPAVPVPDWGALERHLRGKGLLAADTPLFLPRAEPAAEVSPASANASFSTPLPGEPPSPWFIRVILAVGGWVASVVLLVFLWLVVDSGGYRFEARALVGISLIPLGIAFFCFKMPGVFRRNLGFSLALSGAAAACIGLTIMVGSWTRWPFLVAGVLAALCLVMDSAPFRFLAAAVAVPLVAMGIITLGVGGEGALFHYDAVQWFAVFRRGAHMTAVWWSAVSLALAASRLWEGKLLTQKKLVSPVFFGAYGGMMLYLITVLSPRVYLFREPGYFGFMPEASFAVGLGAAAGLLFFVKILTGGGPLNTGQMHFGKLAALGCAALCLPLGWFLPGATLAVFGLALSRHIGNVVMQGATCAFLFAYTAYYYYFLGVPLLHKSLLLGATGLALLALSWALGRFGARLETETRHA